MLSRLGRIGRRNPDLFRGWPAHRHLILAGDDGERLVVIALQHAHPDARPYAALVEKAQQGAVAFVNAAHLVALARFSLGQKPQTSAPAGCSPLRNHWV